MPGSILSQVEIDRWHDELDAASERGAYLYCLNHYVCFGRKPDLSTDSSRMAPRPEDHWAQGARIQTWRSRTARGAMVRAKLFVGLMLTEEQWAEET